MAVLRIALASATKTAVRLYRLLCMENYHADIASDFDKCRQLLKKNRYDIVIIDTVMSNDSVLSLLKDIHLKSPGIQIIILYDGTSDEQLQEYNPAKIHWLPVPGGAFQEVADIRYVMKHCFRTLLGPNKLQAGDIVLDVENGKAIRGEKFFTVTSEECTVLELLIRNKNKIVLRSEIEDKIWGTGFFAIPAKLDNCICSLRNKLESENLPRCIFTISRRGYILTQLGQHKN